MSVQGAAPEPVIEFRHFFYKYRAQKEPTLSDINLKIWHGEKILIAGQSGSGKSTLGHCLNGLIPYRYTGDITGSLRVAGKETLELGIFELSKWVGTVLQDTDGQFVGLTAGEDIAFALENNCVAQDEMKRRVTEAAASTGASHLLGKSPFDLSGGQKQRISMAGVIINGAPILLFDEPLANLDPATGKQAIALIDDLAQKYGHTVIIIEHRLEDVLYRSVDRVILMENGMIKADMPPDRLVSGSLLSETGLREPLYISALKFAGIRINEDMAPGRMDTLFLTETQKNALREWNKVYISARPINGKNETKAPELLTLEHLYFSYASDYALHDISFSIGRGEMTAILGANGAGKSTLAKLLCGFEKPNSGRIMLNGRDMADDSITERARHIGYVMQNPNQMICESMIFDEAAFGPRNRGFTETEVTERVERALNICGLYPFKTWPVSALSFGQKKRLTVASALTLSPEILILDEPTAGQDYKHYSDMLEFLKGLNEKGVTVLMITHDMHLCLEYAKRAIVLTEGRLIADTAPAYALTDEDLTRRASLKQTSLYDLARLCGIDSAAGFVQHYIDRERGGLWQKQ